MFHELLDQEASPASGAALHHAADIMSLHDTAWSIMATEMTMYDIELFTPS